MTDNQIELIEGFLEECKEHLETFENGLLELEKDSQNHEIINAIFRSAHSIKGGAGFFEFTEITNLSHALENLMNKARDKEIILTSTHLDVLLKGFDKLKIMLSNIDETVDVSEEIALVENLLENSVPPEEEKEEPKEEVQVQAPEEEAPAEEIKTQEETQEISHSSLNAEEILLKKLNAFDSPDLKKVIQQEMELYIVRVMIQKDLAKKDVSPIEYIDKISNLGEVVASYIDFEMAPTIEKDLNFELPIVILFATILGDDLVSDALEIDENQIIHLDAAELKEKVMVRDKDGDILTVSDSKEENPEVPVDFIDEIESEIETSFEKPETPVADTTTTNELKEAQESDKSSNEPATMDAKKEEKPKPKAAPKKEAPKKEPAEKEASQKRKNISAAETIRVKTTKLNKLINLAGELVLARNQLLQVSENIMKDVPGYPAILQNLNTIASELQEEIMSTRMQPIATIFNKFSRLIHDLGKSLNKKLDLITEGGDVELDKTILELLSDPLTHIIRNSADHGIESTDDRVACGKSEKGTIRLTAYHLGGMIHIDIVDDGAGIDPEKVCNKAIEKEIITSAAAQSMSDKEKIQLIFAPGFSTAQEVSNLSGRGVGMDVVLTNIKKLGGTVEIKSELGKGTTIQMTLPLTLAIVSSLIVSSEDKRFAISQVNIEEIVRVKQEDFEERVAKIANNDVLKLRGELLPLINLARGVGIQLTYEDPETGEKKDDRRLSIGGTDMNGKETFNEKRKRKEPLRILVIKHGNNKFGIAVDKVLGSEEIVVKPLPEFLRTLTWYAGATILGDGTVSLILDIPGFAAKNAISFEEIERKQKQLKQAELDEEALHKRESTNLLIFNNGSPEQFALAIPLIKRVDEVPTNKLEEIGNKTFIDYHGNSMRLLRLDEILPIQKPKDQKRETTQFIIPKNSEEPIGIMINEIIDTKDVVLELDRNTVEHESILGSAIIDGRITLLLDIYSLIKTQTKEKKKRAKKVLLVEDTPFYLKVESEYLTSDGYQVVTATDGLKALDVIEKDPVDIIVTDIEMPNMDGLDFASEVRSKEKFKNIPIIAVTSVTNPKQIERSKTIGFNKWLQKLNKDELLKELEKF